MSSKRKARERERGPAGGWGVVDRFDDPPNGPRALAAFTLSADAEPAAEDEAVEDDEKDCSPLEERARRCFISSISTSAAVFFRGSDSRKGKNM